MREASARRRGVRSSSPRRTGRGPTGATIAAAGGAGRPGAHGSAGGRPEQPRGDCRRRACCRRSRGRTRTRRRPVDGDRRSRRSGALGASAVDGARLRAGRAAARQRATTAAAPMVGRCASTAVAASKPGRDVRLEGARGPRKLTLRRRQRVRRRWRDRRGGASPARRAAAGAAAACARRSRATARARRADSVMRVSEASRGLSPVPTR